MADSATDASASQAASQPSVAAENAVAATAFDPDEPKKLELRDQNAELSAKRPKDDELKKRDSTVKKCTSMTGRLKQVKEDWLDGRFLQELERVNLSKYVHQSIIATVSIVGPVSVPVGTAVWLTVNSGTSAKLRQRSAISSSRLQKFGPLCRSCLGCIAPTPNSRLLLSCSSRGCLSRRSAKRSLIAASASLAVEARSASCACARRNSAIFALKACRIIVLDRYGKLTACQV